MRVRCALGFSPPLRPVTSGNSSVTNPGVVHPLDPIQVSRPSTSRAPNKAWLAMFLGRYGVRTQASLASGGGSAGQPSPVLAEPQSREAPVLSQRTSVGLDVCARSVVGLRNRRADR